ncbi:MAG: hypothetical protein NTW38_11790 [Candidatus Aminicenantes bacterium]|nr:hypothetical protein [Candidatus Aminicenantes bacterium]
MSNRGLLKDRVHKGAVKLGRRLSLRKPAAYVGASLGALVLVVAVFILVFGDAILNRYGKEKAERAFAEAYPGSVLRIGELDYSVGANRLVAQSATLSATDATLKVGRISLTGVRWAQFLWGTAALADVLAKASLDATNLDIEFPLARYGIRCARLRASGPGSELTAEGTELRSLVGDEAFFAAHDFRTTRFHVVVPECRVSGLAYGELLQGKSYRAKSIHFSRPSFEALVNSDKPPAFGKRPLMVHEALASIRRPLQVDSLSVTNGHISYCERPVVGAAPGILTFGAVSLSVEGIANRGGATAAVQLRAQGDLMNAGTMKVQMSIPITSPDFSLHYSGSLGAMDLSRLSAFLDIVDHIRIKSGSAQEAAFEIDVTAGRARGRVHAVYKDLTIAVLDNQTGAEKGFASFLANLFKIRNSNATNVSGATKESQVNYTRKPQDTFLGFAWAALRSGVLDVIGH